MAIGRDWDLRIDVPARQFFYMPLMHSENLIDQDRCVRLMKTRMPEAEGSLLHARAHREMIRRFGRFPFRNAALGRPTTKPEARSWRPGPTARWSARSRRRLARSSGAEATPGRPRGSHSPFATCKSGKT